MPAACRDGAAAGKTPEPPMTTTSCRGVVSAGHPPANPRTANPTREYQSGSGPTHHHDPARRLHPARPPPDDNQPSTPANAPGTGTHARIQHHKHDTNTQNNIPERQPVDKPFHIRYQAVTPAVCRPAGWYSFADSGRAAMPADDSWLLSACATVTGSSTSPSSWLVIQSGTVP